jgi:signal peptidase II
MATKYIALSQCTRPAGLMPGVFCDVVINRGIVWGIGSGSPWYVLAFLYASVGILIAWLVSYAIQHWYTRMLLPEICVLSGALANVWDRIWYGGVIDFIRISLCGRFSWPTFNIADVVIICGIIGMLYMHSKVEHEG